MVTLWLRNNGSTMIFIGRHRHCELDPVLLGLWLGVRQGVTVMLTIYLQAHDLKLIPP